MTCFDGQKSVQISVGNASFGDVVRPFGLRCADQAIGKGVVGGVQQQQQQQSHSMHSKKPKVRAILTDKHELFIFSLCAFASAGRSLVQPRALSIQD
eukprot:SAG11_NODE_23300_length_391_cov_0.886986_2_plen_96_part_01